MGLALNLDEPGHVLHGANKKLGKPACAESHAAAPVEWHGFAGIAQDAKEALLGTRATIDRGRQKHLDGGPIIRMNNTENERDVGMDILGPTKDPSSFFGHLKG